jgi:hypothetical protein
MRITLIAAFFVSFGLSSCGSARDDAQVDEQPRADEVSGEGKDLYSSSSDISGERGGEPYSSYDEDRDSLEGSRGSLDDYGCTQDCSGHQAGYDWAEQHDVTDESECGGKSWSFQEGCVAYAQEQQSRDDDEPSEETM